MTSDTERDVLTLEVHPRWLPPSPHREKIAEALRAGVCHLEHRGHGQPPLLVFEDGGAMELPAVRWAETERGWVLVADPQAAAPETTRYLDVCGTVDALKSRLAAEPPDLSEAPAMLEHMEGMLRRMLRRREEYEAFVAAARELLERPVRRQEVPPAWGGLQELRERLSASPQEVAGQRAEIEALAEAVRDVAQWLEYALADHKQMALEWLGLYRRVRGARDWSQAEQETDPPQGEQ